MIPISIFSGGLWIIPILLLAGCVYGVIRFVNELNSGTKWYNKITKRWHESDDEPPFYRCWGFWIIFFCVGGLIWFLSSVISEA